MPRTGAMLPQPKRPKFHNARTDPGHVVESVNCEKDFLKDSW